MLLGVGCVGGGRGPPWEHSWAAKEDDGPLPKSSTHSSPSQPACACDLTIREDGHRRINHPSWTCRNLEGKDTENLFSVPEKGLRDFHLEGVTPREQGC